MRFCPKCGKRIDTKEDFKFCIECGKKLEGDFKFCPECGKKIPIFRKEEKPVKTEAKKEATRSKKRKTGFTLPKFGFSKKKVIIFISIICVIAVVCVAVIRFYPFGGSGGTVGGGRTFSITVENNYEGTTASCSILVEGLKYTIIGNQGDFTVASGANVTYQIIEDKIFAQRSTYNITLSATIDIMVEGETVAETFQSKAFDVTEYAMFSIEETTGGYFEVNMTASQ